MMENQDTGIGKKFKMKRTNHEKIICFIIYGAIPTVWPEEPDRVGAGSW